jgi:C-terminal processing protease CtpA/Prc
VILAPKGKLGVVIDTTKHGPVVFQVKDGSPLQGAVFPGDRIIAIDDIDTTGKTASNITTIMASKAFSERRITVVSKKNVHGGAYA